MSGASHFSMHLESLSYITILEYIDGGLSSVYCGWILGAR